MKKMVITIISLFFVTFAYSQKHVEFMGISLGESYKTIHEHLIKEGWKMQVTKEERDGTTCYFYYNDTDNLCTISVCANKDLQLVTFVLFISHFSSKQERDEAFEDWWDFFDYKYGTAIKYDSHPDNLFFFDNLITVTKSYSKATKYYTLSIAYFDSINTELHENYMKNK